MVKEKVGLGRGIPASQMEKQGGYANETREGKGAVTGTP